MDQIGGLRPGFWAGWLALRRRRVHHGRRSGGQPHRPLGSSDLSWHALGNGVDDMVLRPGGGAGGSLYAGGDFSTAGGVVAHFLARWDGSAWQTLGSGMDDYVYVLAVGSDGSLYAGGSFTTAGGVELTPSPVGTGLPGILWVAG